MRKLGLVNGSLNVHMPSGSLAISFSHGFNVRMSGPVQKIATVILDQEYFSDLP